MCANNRVKVEPRAGFPEGETSALAVTCPDDACQSRIWIGASQLERRSRRPGTGCKGQGSCPQCGCRVHVEMTGEGKITVERETA
jgi:hypothetical protein